MEPRHAADTANGHATLKLARRSGEGICFNRPIEVGSTPRSDAVDGVHTAHAKRAMFIACS